MKPPCKTKKGVGFDELLKLCDTCEYAINSEYNRGCWLGYYPGLMTVYEIEGVLINRKNTMKIKIEMEVETRWFDVNRFNLGEGLEIDLRKLNRDLVLTFLGEVKAIDIKEDKMTIGNKPDDLAYRRKT